MYAQKAWSHSKIQLGVEIVGTHIRIPYRSHVADTEKDIQFCVNEVSSYIDSRGQRQSSEPQKRWRCYSNRAPKDGQDEFLDG